MEVPEQVRGEPEHCWDEGGAETDPEFSNERPVPMCVGVVWNRVVPAWTKRVTSDEAFQCEPPAAQRPMAAQRINRVVGAGWREPA